MVELSLQTHYLGYSYYAKTILLSYMHEQKRLKRAADHSDPEQSVTSMLPPANPIISRAFSQIDERVAFRLDTSKPPPAVFKESSQLPKNKQLKAQQQQRKKESVPARKSLQKMSLANGYELESLIFLKHSNEDINSRGKVKYLASMFIPFTVAKTPKLPEYKGMLCEDESFIFESNYQSANLMAVFKIDSSTYDLVLQNDVNTKGFTQWYNFRVRNKKTNFIAKFNIVNLYKTKSLYNSGMKPIVRSQKSDKNNKKVWRRRGFNIFYQKNDLNYEDNPNKYYKTLSFQYDFTTENDVVQFAHCIPYDLNDLKRLLQSIKDHSKVSISTIGTTIMGRSIPMIKISSNQIENKVQKKGLVVMSRQHPGETPGSFIMEEIILQLLRNSNEMQFLTWRYDIYIFPMVNIDGVVLGNYRGNFAGFDLNRCWLKPEQSKQPEVLLIKNAIRKIAKKQQIQLILDLHGHSRKMGSFFYGNDFGSNHMLFPYIASKLNRNILFDQSKFTHQTENDAKFSTARVVLGNLLKQTGGYVYTYEVSFYGYYKQNTEQPFSFQEEHYKQLGKSLVVSIYRTYLEIYKEQKTLKESAYLKNIKGELTTFQVQASKIQGDEESRSGSDSEAEQDMAEEIRAIEQFIQQTKYIDQGILIPQQTQALKNGRPSKKGPILSNTQHNVVNLNEQAQNELQNPRVIIKSSSNNNQKEFKEFGLPVERYNQEIKRKIEQLLDKNMENDFKSVIAQRLPRVPNREHLKSERQPEKDQKHSLTAVNHSALIERTPQIAYLEYLRLKKQQRQCETNLLVHGATFGFQGKKSVFSPNKLMPEDSQKSKIENSYNFMIVNKNEKKLESKDRSSKSHHTIDLQGYSQMNRREQELIEQKPFFPRKKITTNHYIIKQQSQEGLSEPKQHFEWIPKSALQVQRLDLKTPINNNQYLPKINSIKSHSRVKLPSI